MRIPDEIKDYLVGKKFSSGMYWKYNTEPQPIYNRLKLLTSISKNRSILHVGPCDDLSEIDRSIADGSWLHKRLTDKAKIVWGVDINEEAVQYTNKIGYKNIYKLDLISESDKVISLMESDGVSCVDYAILGEMLEHLDDPVSFLKGIKERYCGHVKKLVITVPNALHKHYTKLAQENGSEIINSDHRYWFTPYTICKVITVAGMMPDEILFAGWGDCERLGEDLSQNPLSDAPVIVCTVDLG